MPPKNEIYLTTLTPLRGIAALLVVLFHCNLMLMPWLPDGYTNLVMNGWLWVDFFFILSGFIMSYVYEKYFVEKFVWSQYKKFIGARFARVYPLHFFTTIWAFVMVVIAVNKATKFDPFFAVIFNPKSLPECLLLIQSLHIYRTPPLNTPSWSLSTEWWVYMIFPFMVPLFAKLKALGKTLMLVFIIAFFLFIRYVIGPVMQPFPNGQPGIGTTADWGIIRCLAGFMLGMLLFQFYKNKIAYNFFKKSWCFVLFFILTLVAMHFAITDILIIFLFPFILLSAAYNNTRIKGFLDTKVLQRLGDWSFSIYMVHVPLIMIFSIIALNKDPTTFADMFKQGPPPDYKMGAVLCLVVVVFTIIIAALTYRFIEVPARNYLNKAFKTKAKKINVESVEV